MKNKLKTTKNGSFEKTALPVEKLADADTVIGEPITTVI